MTAADIIRARAKDRNEGNYRAGGSDYLELPAGVHLFKPKVEKGECVEYSLDFITYVVTSPKHPDNIPVGMPWLRLPFWLHSNIGSDGKRMVCRRTLGEHCFLCDERNKLFGEQAPKAQTDALRASFRELYIMLNKDDEFEVMEMAYKNFGKKLDGKIQRLKDKTAGFFEHKASDGGHTAIVTFIAEQYMRSTYPVLDEIDFEERDDIDIDPADVPNLEEMLVIPSDLELKAAYYDMDESDLSEINETPTKEEDDEEPVRRKSRRSEPEEKEEKQEGDEAETRRHRRSRQETPEDEQADEEEKPARRSSRRSVKQEEPNNSDLGPTCPHGHQYGVTVKDGTDECDDCDMWKQCMTASKTVESSESNDAVEEKTDTEQPRRRKRVARRRV